MRADLIVFVHALYVGYVALLPIFILVGACRGWRWIRNPWLRYIHLVMIGVVVGESLVGYECPLTTWEDNLRISAGADPRYQSGYIAHWLHQLIFYEFDEWVFAVGYGVFFVLVLFTWIRVKPRPPQWWPISRRQ